jgi:sulfate adenylyltransferase subunit 1
MDKTISRLILAGNVDDGKSTLLGRLFYDTGTITKDQLKQITSEDIDSFNFARVSDGLSDEISLGITIDVAYKFFETKKKKFIIADCPGHVQYTRNMFTGASTANIAILLVDVTKSLTEQTKRHLFIISLLRIPHLVICFNKMDLIDYDESKFINLKKEFLEILKKLSIVDVRFVPTSALTGENITPKETKMDWYKGSDFLTTLENIHVHGDENNIDLRIPIQFSDVVSKENHLERYFFGKILSGNLKKGDSVRVLPSGIETKVQNIFLGNKLTNSSETKASISFTLEDQVDVSRGDMIIKPFNFPKIENKFEAMICWFSLDDLNISKKYLILINNKQCYAKIQNIRYVVDLMTMSREGLSNAVKVNDIAKVEIRTAEEVMFDKYAQNRLTGSFILIDEFNNKTLCAGVIA